MKTAIIRKVKLDGGVGRWPAHEFATDRHGRWLFSPKGTLYRGYPLGGEVVEIEVGQGNRSEGLHVMHLIPRTAWWISTWYELAEVRRIYVDICTPATRSGDEWSFVDLELDPHWGSDGVIAIDDENEFEALCTSGAIGPDEAAAARKAADEVIAAMHVGMEPFGSVGWERYDEAVSASLGPIRAMSDAHTA